MMTKKENELSPATSRWPYHRRRPSWFDKLLKNMKCKKADKACFEIKIRLEKYRLRRYWSDKLECATCHIVTVIYYWSARVGGWVANLSCISVELLYYLNGHTKEVPWAAVQMPTLLQQLTFFPSVTTRSSPSTDLCEIWEFTTDCPVSSDCPV